MLKFPGFILLFRCFPVLHLVLPAFVKVFVQR